MARQTKQRILQAACDMMADKGYQNVTVKEIAERAGVSEMTIFRKFNTKLAILQELITEYSYVPYFKNLFDHELTGELAEDLEKVAHTYLSYMYKNKSVFLIVVQERGNLPQLMEIISKQNTQQLQRLLAYYLDQNVATGKLKPISTEQKAIEFLTTLFGFFVSVTLWDNHFIKHQEQMFVKSVVDTFLNGIES